jgi:hypothetical protein
MPSDLHPRRSRFDDRTIIMQLIVHIQTSDCGSTDRSRTQNITGILAPQETEIAILTCQDLGIEQRKDLVEF